MGLFYGRGAYFSDSAAYCDESYAYVPLEQPGPQQQQRQLILAHVLCGEVKEYGLQKKRALKFPPEGFDSVRGGPHKFNPTAVHSCNMTVVYDRTQVYPQYIVTYRNAQQPLATTTCVAGAGVGVGASAGTGASAGAVAGAAAFTTPSHNAGRETLRSRAHQHRPGRGTKRRRHGSGTGVAAAPAAVASPLAAVGSAPAAVASAAASAAGQSFPTSSPSCVGSTPTPAWPLTLSIPSHRNDES